MFWQLTLKIIQLGLQHFMRRRCFKVDTQQLLLAAEHTQLHRRANVGIIVQACCHTGIFQQATQRLTGFIRTHDREQRNLPTQCHDITGNVSGTAGSHFFLVHMHDRHWRFWRNAGDFTEPVAVQHDISNNEQTGLREIDHGHGVVLSDQIG